MTAIKTSGGETWVSRPFNGGKMEKVYLVTGGSSGIGLEIASRLKDGKVYREVNTLSDKKLSYIS